MSKNVAAHTIIFDIWETPTQRDQRILLYNITTQSSVWIPWTQFSKPIRSVNEIANSVEKKKYILGVWQGIAPRLCLQFEKYQLQLPPFAKVIPVGKKLFFQVQWWKFQLPLFNQGFLKALYLGCYSFQFTKTNSNLC